MLGLIIGDLAAWTWQHNKQIFYNNLVSSQAVLSEFGKEALSIVEPILAHRIDDFSYLNDKRRGSLYFVEAGWCSSSEAEALKYSKKLDDKLQLKKQGFYASKILAPIIWRLRNGYSKKDAIKGIWGADELTSYDKGNDDLMGVICRAWDAFYRSFDFTSAIHSAVKSPVNPRLTAAIAGALAEAMYGCDYLFLKKKYSGVEHFTAKIKLPELDSIYTPALNAINDLKHKERVFFPKNSALTNVENHTWYDVSNPLADKVVSEELRRRIFKAYHTSFEARYGIYLDDGWHYIYRSGFLLFRFRLEEHDYNWRITSLQRSEEQDSSKEDVMNDVFYVLEYKWYSVSDDEKPEYLKYCKYYKGEIQCPDDIENRNFWILERAYYANDSFQDLKRRKYWEEGKGYKLCIDTFPELRDFILNQDKVTRGFLACTAIYSYSHTPQSGVEYLLDYGINKKALALCKYYKGEVECPFDYGTIQRTFWDLEQGWVKLVLTNETRSANYALEFSLDFPDNLDYIDIPLTLKAAMYDRYYHFMDGKDGFPEFLIAYINNAPD